MLHPLFVPGIDPDGLQGEVTIGTSIPPENYDLLIDRIENVNFRAGVENNIRSILGCIAHVQRVHHEPFRFHGAHERHEPLGFQGDHGLDEPHGIQGPHVFQRAHGRREIHGRHGRFISRHVNIFLHCDIDRRHQR